MPMRNPCVPLLALLFAGFASLASAQTPRGPEFRVNVETEGHQHAPEVAMNARGQFVISWAAGVPAKPEERSLYVRRYEADGTPATGEILVENLDNIFSTGWSSSVALMEDGSFVVAVPRGEAGRYVLAVRRYTPDGTPVGDDVVVARDLFLPFQLATRGDGSFVILWSGLRARAFGADGRPLGPGIVVARTGDSANLAAGPDGDFVVVWSNDEGRNGTLSIRAQRFAPNGRRLGKPIAVTPGKRQGLMPAYVALDGAGNALVAWIEHFGRLGRGTFARWYGKDGTPRTGILRLSDDLILSDLAADARGNFVLAWAGFPSPGPGISGQRFISDGRPFRPAFVAVNDNSIGFDVPRLASDAAGNFAVVWESDKGGDGYDVFARLFAKR